jgi:hypothetical protein
LQFGHENETNLGGLPSDMPEITKQAEMSDDVVEAVERRAISVLFCVFAAMVIIGIVFA